MCYPEGLLQQPVVNYGNVVTTSVGLLVPNNFASN